MSQGSGGEKTEKATQKKRNDARKKGQVLRSQDLVMALSLLVMVGAIYFLGDYMVAGIEQLLTVSLGREIPDYTTRADIPPLFLDLIIRYGLIVLPIMGVALVAGMVFNIMQVGFMFTTESLKPTLSKLSMVSGFKRLFSGKAVVELLKTMIKFVVIVWVAYSEYMRQIEKAPQLMTQNLVSAIANIPDMIFSVAIKMAVALLIMAPFDLLYQWWKYEKDLKMTKQEVKDEFKMIEGDPQIKGKIRQKQQQMSAMRMMEAVAQADVIITNPTHYAIALSYREGQDKAPRVIAKGKDYVAQKIREKAREHNIELVENKPLAQYLYFYCEIGDEIPEDVYQAVAEILAYIFRLKNGPVPGVR